MRTILPHQENPALREMAREIPVSDIGSPRVQTLISEMKALLAHEEYGVALAASQIGEPVRIFLVSGRAIARGKRKSKDESAADTKKLAGFPDQVYINPEIVKLSRGRTDKHEGCLSVRGLWGMVPRAEKATVRAYDENGTLFTRGAAGLLAHIFQHEMDHLNGILYTDKAVELYDEERND